MASEKKFDKEALGASSRTSKLPYESFLVFLV
jgi:hypothetical protein